MVELLTMGEKGALTRSPSSLFSSISSFCVTTGKFGHDLASRPQGCLTYYKSIKIYIWSNSILYLYRVGKYTIKTINQQTDSFVLKSSRKDAKCKCFVRILIQIVDFILHRLVVIAKLSLAPAG